MNEASEPGKRISARTAGVIALVAVAVLFIIPGAIYTAVPAGSLPSFFPGHIPGSTGHHPLRVAGAFAVALICLGTAVWLARSGSRPAAAQESQAAQARSRD